MKATYGRDVESTKDEYVLKMEQTGRIVNGEDAPGASVIDLLPVCK